MIRALTLILTLTAPLLAALPAAAQDPPAGTLIAGLSGDWNGDDQPDLVLLLTGEPGQDDGADLVVYLGDGRGLTEDLRVPGAVWGGPMWGQAPGLSARTPTSFVLHSEQTAVGRSPWTREVTVAFRNGGFVVAGFTHATYDRIDNTAARCDVNLLTGGWEVVLTPADDSPPRRLTGRDGPRAFALAELDETYWPPVCDPLSD
jgi:hypothetical protein